MKLAATGARGEVIIKASGLAHARPGGQSIPRSGGPSLSEMARPAEKDGPIHIDHVLAVANGGTDELDNLVVACAACNISKGDRLVEEGYPAVSGPARLDAARLRQALG